MGLCIPVLLSVCTSLGDDMKQEGIKTLGKMGHGRETQHESCSFFAGKSRIFLRIYCFVIRRLSNIAAIFEESGDAVEPHSKREGGTKEGPSAFF